MSVSPGTRLGAYEILSPLGAGGMGEVYRARDTRLQRDVAIKVLPPAFANDPDRLARFEREAQLLASLNHPNIAAIYGVEEKALILELVDGPTLADRIGQGPVPLDEAVPIARQIAEALEAAHEQGVIHRDLKPANIKLRGDGTVKVLDFGLAKLHEPNVAEAPSTPSLATLSPTVLSPAATQIGVILGTAAYMSPEQAKGRPADRRADMWAFGCVLFEMLTGKRAFDGEDVTDFVVAVLSREPDWSLLSPATPASVHRLIRRCLAKDRRQRLADAATARLELDETPAAPASAATVGSRRGWLPWGIAAAALVAAIVGFATRSTDPPQDTRAVRFELRAPSGTTFPPGFSNYVVSPDGQRIAFEGVAPGSRRSVWIRRLDSTAATEVPGTEGARIAAWSADGGSLAFLVGGKLRRVDVAGGGAQALADAASPAAAWSVDNVILYSGNDGLHSIRSSGGGSITVTTIDKSRGEVAHSAPCFLPDGRRFLYLAVNDDPNASTVVLASLDGGERRAILSGTSNAIYSDGHLLYVRGGTLMAHGFDVDNGALIGQPVVVAESVRQATNGRAAFGAAGGTLAFDASREFPEAEFASFSRRGEQTGTFSMRSPSHSMWPSPDFRRVVVESGGTSGSTDLWMIDGDRKSRTKLTDGPNTEGHPVWSRDGKQIAFFEGVVGVKSRLLVGSATGIGAPRVLVDTPTYKQVSDWSRDGKLLVFEEMNATTGWDVGVVPLDGSAPPKLLINTRFVERLGTLSPDSRFLAYTSTDTGQTEVYVVDFPEVTEKWLVSAGGGTKPRWRGDGAELFYLSGSNELMSVTVKPDARFVPGVPQRLFDLQVIGSDGWDYAVSDDGQRFLSMRYGGGLDFPISVIANWTATLRK